MRINNYSEKALELIKGGYDLHVHTTPSHMSRSLDDFELAQDADQYGMAGVMIKNHYEPTGARAIIGNRYSGAKAKLYGGVTLNWPIGGINPYAVESSLKLGCKMVWMPTRDAVNSLIYGDMPGDFFKRPGISLYDEKGDIKTSVFEVLEVVKKYDAHIATGHLSAKEGIDLCKAARNMNVKTILTHPDWERTVVPLENQWELVKRGVLIEKVWMNIADGHISPEDMAHSMKILGSERIFMVTDRGQANQERPVEGMLKFIDCMLDQGLGDKDINNMVINVPRSIIGQ